MVPTSSGRVAGWLLLSSCLLAALIGVVFVSGVSPVAGASSHIASESLQPHADNLEPDAPRPIYSVTLPPCGTPESFTGSINNSDLTHTNYMTDLAGPSSCLAPRSCPVINIGPEEFHYDTYTFTNPDAAPRQVNVTINGSACQRPLGVASMAYLGSYNPADLCQNWVASTGGPVTGITSYSFSVPASGTFVIVVEEYSTTIGCASYELSVTVECTQCGEPTATRTHTPAVTSTPVATQTSPPTHTPVQTSTPTNEPSRTATGTATPCAMTFLDVLSTDYFYVPVRYLYCAGVISGYSDNTFRPYANTTRGQISKIVILAFSYPIYTPQQPTFSDVPLTDPFYQYIETAAYNNIVSGYADGTFRPFNNVTRGQLCKIVVVAAGWSLSPPPRQYFIDVPHGHPFFTFIQVAYEHGIISGYSCGPDCLEFRPGNNATRGQISKIVYEAVIAP
jgi:hypothetical protein